jgi:hypothetical protein
MSNLKQRTYPKNPFYSVITMSYILPDKKKQPLNKEKKDGRRIHWIDRCRMGSDRTLSPRAT